jgi:hypothetical protein
VDASVVGDHPCRTLGGQDQRGPEGATQAGDAFELGLVFRILHDHFCEFIDDDEQMWECIRQLIALL